MVGRNGIDSLQLIGTGSAPDLGRIAREANGRVGFTLVDEILSSGGSDHMSFQKRNVPSLFLHSGLHPDYHQVVDNPDRINYAKVARTARLAFLTALLIANDSQRYIYIPKPISLF
jgi:aminopeptidase YwaD